jgi:isoquinoline 1-oxidoreductase beta subunit
METDQIIRLSRRQFLEAGLAAAAGLTLGIYTRPIHGAMAAQEQARTGAADGAILAPNAFVRITPDNTVTVIAKHLEMGQGTYTGLATLVAEELDAAWDQVQVEPAPADAERYNNLLWGPVQGTGGSTAIANAFTQMRKAGAAAREMLVAAAAKDWAVPAAELVVQAGVVRHRPSGRSATFGDLAELATQQPVPEEVWLKDPDEFRLIGAKLTRKDTPEKLDGEAIFTQDLRLPDMVVAVVARPPRFGAKLKRYDDTKTRKVRDVVDVVRIDNGVAVLASNTWAAIQGRDALMVEWDESTAMQEGSAALLADFATLAEGPGKVARSDGDADQALANAKRTIEAEYTFPYLAHAALEPMNCLVQITDGGCEIWNGEQFQTPDQQAVAQFLGIEPGQVKIHMLYAGGSFGRRANPQSDYVLEAVAIAKASKRRTPVKMVWTREDDMGAGYFRPLSVHRVRAGVDEAGEVSAWHQRIVTQSIMTGTAFEASLVKEGVDETSVEGAADMPYALPNVLVELHSPKVQVPVQWWRSVGHTHTAFVVETLIDELAATTAQDPVAFRRSLLEDEPRWLGVLDLAARKAGWGEADLGPGRGRGIAVHKSFNTYVAEVAEVTVRPDESFSVDRVVIAVDCGIAVNPDVVVAQMEGGMGFGLAAALVSEITLAEGRVEQSNFDGYEVLRLSQMPRVEVHIVPSDQPPTGVGEPAVPVIAPAVANALAAATGKRLRKLPLRLKS